MHAFDTCTRDRVAPDRGRRRTCIHDRRTRCGVVDLFVAFVAPVLVQLCLPPFALTSRRALPIEWAVYCEAYRRRDDEYVAMTIFYGAQTLRIHVAHPDSLCLTYSRSIARFQERPRIRRFGRSQLLIRASQKCRRVPNRREAG